MRSLTAGILCLTLFPLFACGNRVVGWEVPDTAPPTVSSTTPANDAMAVALNATISATFSELMAPATINGTTFLLEQGTALVPGVVMYVGVTAVFTPIANLSPNTLYKATITTGAEDLAGNAVAANYVWSFTTGGDADTTAPWVTSTSPLTDATNVPINAAILASFSEAMDPMTITGATFKLLDGATPVPGSVAVVGASALYTPTAPLDPDTLYTATVTTGVKDLAGNAMAANHMWAFRTSADVDSTAPWVTANYPLDDATNVPIDSAVLAIFSEAMDPLSVSATTFTLLDGTTPVPGSVINVGVSALFMPEFHLDPDTLYTATVTTGAEDLAGNAMAANHVWSFRTGLDLDTTAPVVIATNPVTDATDVSVQASVIVIFSKAMAGATISDATFTLVQGATPVTGVVSSLGATATFKSDLALANNTTYQATISATVTDVAGNPLGADYSWSFTTGTGSDITAPYVVATIPETDATDVELALSISADFSEAMDPATITDTTFTLADGTTPVPGTVTYAGVTASFTPADSLDPDTLYTATITVGATDLVGNPMTASHVWTFTTGPMPDIVPPSVTSTVPVDDATNVALDISIVAVFSEAMDPATITSATYTLLDGATPVPGTVSLVGVSALFTPTAPLDPDTLYTATVTTGVEDLAGNAMAANYVWSFRTSADVDSTAPWVTANYPLSDATNVPIDSAVMAVFSEAMDPLSVSTATFTLLDGTTPVPGTVSLVGVSATFQPTLHLDPNTLYTATVTTGVEDLAGNAMAANYVWSFTTGVDLDTTAPFVVATNPLANATDVSINAAILAVFSEAMDPTTISDTTFKLLDGATPVPGYVTVVGASALFTPTTPLDPNTLYTATVTTGVEDLAGNAMAANHVWSFRTSADVDSTAPWVTANYPLSDATNVPIDSAVMAVFSEAMDPLSVSTATFTLLDGTTPVSGTVILVGVSAIFLPEFHLDPDTLYTATVTTGVEDLTGNAMAANHVWTFRTGVDLDTTAPFVVATNPLTDATDVSINAAILAVFSEAMDPMTISGTTFTLLDGATPVPGSVTVVGASALFTPTAPLDPDTLYTATVTTGVKDLAGNAMAANHVWSFKTSMDEDSTAPWITANYPLDDATDVPIDSAVLAVFSETMDPLSVSTATFTLLDGTTPVPGSVINVGVSALFMPEFQLDPDTLYTATVTTGAKDLAGNAMAANHVWSFTTGMESDTTAPVVIATNPVTDATDVSVQASVIVIFSKVMAGATISDTTFTLFQGATPVTGVVSSLGATATFKADLALADNTTYLATISATVTDVAGNPLGADYSWSFTTGTGPDITAPYVIATIPETGATDVELALPISADFSEAMDPATITDTTFTLFDGAMQVLGAVAYAGVTAFFTPNVQLAPNTLYTATITVGATDLVGNPMAASHVWTFTTGPMPDIVRPRVTSTVPVDDATNVALGSSIVAIFSEAMDPATINAANFTVQQLEMVVEGIVTYVGLTATFSPTDPLEPNTTYSVTVTTAAMDLAGNSLTKNYVWNFRTGNVPDTTRPMVLSTIPEDGELDVVLDTNVSATFSEAMDPLTLTDISFILMDELLDPVLGVVTSIGNTVSFNPDIDLEPDTEYMATITAVAADLSGNTLLADYEWEFTTGTMPDEEAPTVIDTNPLDLEIDVPLESAVNATFSEDMDPLTITTANFTVTGPALVEVSGQVAYDTMSRIGTFTPDDELLPETLYTATVTTGVEDLAGNPMLMDYVWEFSTGEEVQQGILPVNLGSLTTFVAVAGAGLTNSNSGGITTLNGDVGLSPTATCLGDGSPCTITNPVINGTLYANDPEGVAALAKVDLIAAYVDATTRPVGTTVNDISGMVLTPGVYTSNSTMSVAVGGTVTLDGMGDANSVFIFQIGSSLTVNNSAQVLLINGAKAKNVFWAVFASSTLGSNVSFHGSVLAGASNSVGTGSVVIGRLLCTTGQITLLSNTITLPPL